MPTPLKTVAKAGTAVSKTGAVSYVKFSDKADRLHQ